MHPLLALGFRPFYLLAGAFSALSIAVWAAQFAGWLPAPVIAGPLWHAHEMVFGYTLAVIVGFLFTAGRNWTQQATPTGAALAAIAALWIAARVLVLAGAAGAAVVFDAAFAIAAAVGLAIPLWRSRNTRNYFFVPLLLFLGLLNVAFYRAMAGQGGGELRVPITVALDAVLFIVVVMGGRVIPMFTNNGVPGAKARRVGWLEKASLGAVLALMAADLLRLPAGIVAAVALAAAVAHGARLALWDPLATLRTPLVWILHASYAWLVVHLALRGAAELGYVAPSLATHALTAGGIGGITVGMMTRTSRGHTGRMLRAEAAEVWAYVLVMAAAVARVFVPWAVPEWTVPAIVASGALWAAAFAVFTAAYWPILSRPRVDGRPG